MREMYPAVYDAWLGLVEGRCAPSRLTCRA